MSVYIASAYALLAQDVQRHGQPTTTIFGLHALSLLYYGTVHELHQASIRVGVFDAKNATEIKFKDGVSRHPTKPVFCAL